MTAYAGDKIIPLRKLRVLRALCGEIMVNLRKSCMFLITQNRGTCPQIYANQANLRYLRSINGAVK